MKQAVILAAGAGVRLSSVSNGSPKCMLTVGGRTLIEHQLRTLHQLGITRICVVVGHGAAQVQQLVGSRCDFITNCRYAETNSLYSLWLARQWVTGPFIMLNSDVLAHPDIYHRVIAVNGSALAYDATSGAAAEHMKVSLRGGLVCGLGKDLSAAKTHGENVGIMQFGTDAVQVLFAEAEAVIRSGQERSWAPAAVDRLVKQVSFRGIDISGLPWTEIDFPEDLLRAQCSTWPAISAGQSGCRDGECDESQLKRVS